MKTLPVEPTPTAREDMHKLRYPDFVCIGAQKAATTWLFQQLRKHPAIWLPPVKELHYFDQIHLPRRKTSDGVLTPAERSRLEKTLKGIRAALDSEKLSEIDKLKRTHCLSLIGMRGLTDEWYGRIFEIAPAQSICGELTPEYALLPQAGVEHIVRLNPNVKIIFLMRDPIDRAWSSLRMALRAGVLENARKTIQGRNFVGMSDYMATIERYRQFVLPENLLLLYFDDVTARPRDLLQQVCDFLHISFARGKFSKMSDAVHKGQRATLDPAIYDQLKKALGPIYERLLALDSPIVDEWYRKHFGAPPMRRRNSAHLVSATPGD
jgi:hypothetical protein